MDQGRKIPALAAILKKLPSWLKQHGFHEKIGPSVTLRLEPPPYSMHLDTQSGVRNADEIAGYAEKQAVLLQQVLEAGSFALALGGDCSILIGAGLALKKMGRYGLFYLDGHHDFMHPSLSETAGAAGMETAIVTGHGHDKLTNIHDLKPYFGEQHVWCVGNREYDDAYIDPILRSSIHYTDLKKLRKEGTKHCVDSFLEMVKKENLDGFWIHLDVDVLNDKVMPAVDSRAEDGLSYDELDELLRPALQSSKAMGLEITILDPELDPGGKYTLLFIENFCRIFKLAR
jgi:arginase